MGRSGRTTIVAAFVVIVTAVELRGWAIEDDDKVQGEFPAMSARNFYVSGILPFPLFLGSLQRFLLMLFTCS